MNGYAEQVRNVIQQLPNNQLFYARMLWEEKLVTIPEKTYYKSLERLVKQKELVHLTKGLYYRPYIDKGEIVPISTENIVAYYTDDLSGVVVGEALYEKAGIIEAKSSNIEVLSNRLTDNQKTVGDVLVKRVDLVLNDDTIPVIETMEILQNYQNLEKPKNGRLLVYMKHFAESYSEENTAYVLENRKYKKSTIAFLRQILDWYAVKNSLGQYLSALSEYKIPRMEDLRQERPEYVQKALDLYVEKVKAVYGEHIRRILLYGSYARGDFNEDSDIDVMILLDISDMEIKKYRHSLSEITYDINMELEIEINPIAKHEEEFMKWVDNYPFYANIKREGVELFGAA